MKQLSITKSHLVGETSICAYKNKKNRQVLGALAGSNPISSGSGINQFAITTDSLCSSGQAKNIRFRQLDLFSFSALQLDILGDHCAWGWDCD